MFPRCLTLTVTRRMTPTPQPSIRAVLIRRQRHPFALVLPRKSAESILFFVPTPTVKVSGRVVGMDIAPTAQQLQSQAQQQAQQAQQQGRGGRGGNNNNPQNDNRGRGGGRFGGNMQVLLTRVGASVGGQWRWRSWRRQRRWWP